MSTARPTEYDVIVVGARVAGASTSMLLARRGHRVLLVDRGQEGGDTLSTHALMKAGVIQLHRWGLLDQIVAAETPPVRHTTMHYDAEPVVIATKPVGGIDALYAPRRTVLDPILVNAARDAGVEVRYGVSVSGLIVDDGAVIGIETRTDDGKSSQTTARLVVGADGIRSRIARAVGAQPYWSGTAATSVIYAYFEDLGVDGYEWFFAPGAIAGVIPTNGGSLAWISTTPERFRAELRADLGRGFDQVMAEVSPFVAAELAHAERRSPWRSSPGHPGFVRSSWGPGWALVGDAAHFKDPISAHGLTDAMRDAELLATGVDGALRGTATTAEAMAAYQLTRDGLSADLHQATERLASFDWGVAELPQLLLDMSQAMKPEVEAVLALDGHMEVVA